MNQNAAKPPMFSVIMPVYNHAHYVVEAVESIKKQTFGDWELIIVDDGSTDGSEKIVEAFAQSEPRITAIHRPNGGCSAARATGLAKARGLWLAYLDSDDLWFPETLQRYAEFIAAHPDAKFFYGFRHRLNEDGSITELKGEFQNSPSGTKELFGRMYISHLCVTYPRKFLEEVGGYDPALRHADDYDLYLRMSLLTRFEPLNAATGLRRRHAGCISRQTGYSRMLEAEVLKRFVEKRGGKDILSPQQVSRRLGKLYYSAARQYFKAHCFAQAVEACRRAHRYQRTFKSTFVEILARLLLPLGKNDGKETPLL